jgi:type IV pilus assembly protein PilQ
VDNIADLNLLEEGEPLRTEAYKVNYATATEISQALQGIVSTRGSVNVGAATNTIIVTDIERVHANVARLVSQLDVRTPQVTIHAKIIFVNRTDLNEFGVTYDLKDSAGNQLNVVAPGAVDTDGDGTIELPDEQVEIGTNVFSLGGNSVAALGNATTRVAGPALTLLSSLLVGRHTLLSFVEALESLNLSEIQAEPMVTVADNNTANIQVGEDTPLRVVDASAGGGEGGLPAATVQTVSTGIILAATPHVTADNDILLDLSAERSAPVLAASDAGFIFQKQLANTRVLVRDGQTVVIAGLTVSELAESRSGIPMLMELPFIGRLFRVTRKSHVQRDLIILVTPHIVRDN